MKIRILLSVLVCLYALHAGAQSLSGNLSEARSSKSLGYGTVDIYQENKLVASVLTDKHGNFKVDLDTGYYECIVNYAGFEAERKIIRVQNDEKADFLVKEDPTKARPRYLEQAKKLSETDGEGAPSGIAESRDALIEKRKSMYAYGVDEYVYDGSKSEHVMSKGGMAIKGMSGALTAGEINDFAKWKAWTDLKENELQMHQTNWELSPSGRYTVEVQSSTGLPLANAAVSLLDERKLITRTLSDNTGKAELWLNLSTLTTLNPKSLSIEIDYFGSKKTIRNVKPFERGINYAALAIDCREINDVDIAFVVDGTGSMGDELHYLQEELNDIMYQSKQISSKLNFRFANVFYRDEGPMEQFLTRSMDFSRILSESVEFINNQRAGGGGDYEEAVEIALDTAINKLSWSKEARARIIFLILDAPPHNSPERRQKLQKLMSEASEKGIRIVPVGASGINKSTEYLMRAIALATNGTYTFLTNHSGIGGSHIEPSTDSYKTETLNSMLVRILKSYTYMPDCEQNIPDLQLDYPDSTVVIEAADSLRDTTNIIPGDSLRDSMQVSQLSWNYYPNPTNGIVNIIANVDIEELYLTDLTGKVLQIIKKIEKNRTIQIDLSSYVTGIYLLRYPYEDTWISGKVVLHRN